jgi:ankyrin repeat protein
LLSYFSPQSGNTALHLASKQGCPEVVELLVQSHADVNIKDNVSTESPH